MEWDAFIESLLERLHQLREQGELADVLILLGRRDRLTDTPLPPTFRYRVHNGRYIEG